MILTEETEVLGEESFPSVTSSTTNPTMTGLETKAGLRSKTLITAAL